MCYIDISKIGLHLNIGTKIHAVPMNELVRRYRVSFCVGTKITFSNADSAYADKQFIMPTQNIFQNSISQ